MHHIVIVSALKRELYPLLQQYPEAKPVSFPEGILQGAGHWHFLITGIGAENVRKTMRVYMDNFHPFAILNIGSAGRLHAGVSVADIYAVEKVIFEGKLQRTDTGSITGGCKTASLVTVAQPVLDAHARNNLYEHLKGDLVDMEAFHLSLFAVEKSLPFYCFKVVTDSADENTGDDFKKNSKYLSEKLCRFIHEHILPVLNPRK